ncbi:MAG: hypothetical protein ACRD1T_21670, partial [Acidimicrobiia bacterium]
LSPASRLALIATCLPHPRIETERLRRMNCQRADVRMRWTEDEVSFVRDDRRRHGEDEGRRERADAVHQIVPEPLPEPAGLA